MILGITMGDASGVGPEIALTAYRDGSIRWDAVVFGDYAVLERCNAELGLGVGMRRVARPSEFAPGALNVCDLGRLRAGDVRIGQVDAASGAAARDYVIAATQAALAGEIAAIITLPMNKEAAQLSDPGFVGHTELIGALCGVRDVTILLWSEQLIVTHVTTHVSMREALGLITRARVETILRLTWEALRRLKPGARIAVAGLNPHAGENGLFGREEIEEIRPAIEAARAAGMDVEGPVPGDTVFYQAVRRKRYDAVVCMYHDQGHAPLKLLDFEGGVNVALGLPIVRTSVDHGTAFDIAWKGVASTRSLIAALELAARLARSRE